LGPSGFDEEVVILDGQKHEWLSVASEITDNKIHIFSEMNANPKKSIFANIDYHWYELDLLISRKTGNAVRKMRYSYTDTSLGLFEPETRTYDYIASGLCKIAQNKF